MSSFTIAMHRDMFNPHKYMYIYMYICMYIIHRIPYHRMGKGWAERHGDKGTGIWEPDQHDIYN